MRRTVAVLVVLGIAMTGSGCESSSWSEKCSTDSSGRRCDISVSGTKFNELPFPASGPIMERMPDRFRLEESTSGGTARFSAGGTEGGTYTCRQGETVQVADATITCNEVGDTALKFTYQRNR